MNCFRYKKQATGRVRQADRGQGVYPYPK